MTENEIKSIVQNTLEKVKAEKNLGATLEQRSSRGKMTLALAKKLCAAVQNEAVKMGVKAVVCVSDDAGNPRLMESMDGAYIASYDVAVNKAYTVVALKMSTKKLSTLAVPGAELYGIQFTNGGKIVIFGGGEPLCGSNGEIIGGLGVSGGSEAEDTSLAAFGKMYFEKIMR